MSDKITKFLEEHEKNFSEKLYWAGRDPQSSDSVENVFRAYNDLYQMLQELCYD